MATPILTSSEPMPPDAELVEVIRFFFALPEPLPLPSDFFALELVGEQPHELGDADSWVRLRLHQVTMPGGRAAALVGAMLQVAGDLSKSPGRRGTGAVGDLDQLPPVAVTVADAITPARSPVAPASDWSGEARDLSPRSDAFNRCVQLVQDYARAYRLAAHAPYGTMTYERLPPIVLAYTGGLRQCWETDQGLLHIADPREVEWSGPDFVLLEHLNLGDPTLGPEVDEEIVWRTKHWLYELRSGAALLAWREHLAAAERAMAAEGDYGAAVVLAQTASEVLLDRLLALLLWEEGRAPAEAASKFEEGKLSKRVRTELPPRLGGTCRWKVRDRWPRGIDWRLG